MKTKLYLFFILTIVVCGNTFSQTVKPLYADTGSFNYDYWNGIADKKHLTVPERAELLEGQKNNYLDELNHKHSDPKDFVWFPEPQSAQKGYSSNTTNAGPCTNIDFEAGTIAGWTVSAGWNPLVNNSGCCSPTVVTDYSVMTGAGLDPFGGFPVVYPGGGSFSLKLGSTIVGGKADRISQTFFVTPANANFTYRYAVVLNDPNHSVIEQPYFTSEIVDSLNQIVNCTVYTVSAGGGIPGFTTSTATGPNNTAVRTKAWTDVAVDLTPNIGQNVTIRFTVYDCSLTGHFAYAYIDGICTNFDTSRMDTICPNVPFPMCAPAGFASTTWNGPGIVNDPNQCILVSAPGIYTCTTLLGPGCPGPTFSHTLINRPFPNLIVVPVSSGPCSTQYTFNNNSTLPSPYSFISTKWNFGDGSVSTLSTSPVHNYTSPGTYPVKFVTLTDAGCSDSTTSFITIFPTPSLSFSPPSHCINTVIQFTNTSTIGVGQFPLIHGIFSVTDQIPI